MRLNRFLASAGLGSRRSCEELIRTGQVTINGALCETLATKVSPNDVVKVGSHVLRSAAPTTLLLHKPPGFLCTASDTHERRTIFELLPPNFPRLFHVGRLDRESEGLLLLTNDGDLSLKLTHPRYKVEKEYEVVLDRAFDFELATKLLHGIPLEEGWAKAESVYKLGSTKLKVVLKQGMKRQIRLMFFALGYEVKRLVRVRIGPLQMQNMPPGSWRVLTQKEIDALLAEGAKSAAEPEERRVRKARPALRSILKRTPSSRPRAEEIPFTPRASRAEGERPRPTRPERAERSERPARPARPGGKPFAKKAVGSKTRKPAGKPAAKAAPKAFAKFDRRRSG
ncbi:MAG: pseudouridine synthase [Verrucomicrobia bacterium]|nr:pseudouridine synthase [Verrucomicrobiota bacterium]